MENTHTPRYYGDGEDNFSNTEWERELWALLRETYTKKVEDSKRSNSVLDRFSAPDYETIVECEEILRSRGVVQTFR
jgi:hypothetical protein